MSPTLKRIIALVLTVILTSLLCISMYYHDNKYNENSPQAIDGLLVVEKDSLKKDPVRHLVSGWAFYPDVLLSPKDFAEKSPSLYRMYTAIGENTHFNSTGDTNDPHGSATYLLNLRLPKERATYALEIPEIYSAYKLYVDDRLVLQMGNPEPNAYTPRTQNRMITFDASEKSRILIAVSDYSHFYSGMVYPPSFGTPFAVNMERGLRMGISLFTNALSFLAAALALYFGVRMKHQNAKLFSLLCVAMCAFTSYGLTHSVFTLPIYPWYALEIAAGYLFTLLVIILHNRICEVGFYTKSVSVTVASLVCLTALCYGLLSGYLTVPVINGFSVMLFCFKLAVPIYLLVTGFLALRNRDNGKVTPLFYGSIVYATTFVWDRIFPTYEPILSGWLIEWGSLALVITIGYTLWREITTAYSNSVLFAQEHRLMTRQLAMQTEYAKQLQKSNEVNRRLTHDFRHRLHTIEALAVQYGEHNEVLQYLSNQGDLSIRPAFGMSFCNNIAINALLQYYTAMTVEKQIETDFQLLIPDKLPLTDVELCTVLGNLLENAVESCQRQKEGKKYIRISSDIAKIDYFIVIENSSDGNYQLSGGRFLSRKPGDLRFGIGLESVRNTVEQHGGSLDVFPETTKFRAGITLKIQ